MATPTNEARQAEAVTRELLSSGQITRRAATKILTALGRGESDSRENAVAVAREDFLSFAVAGLALAFSSLGEGISGLFVVRQKQKVNATPAVAAKYEPSSISTFLSFETLSETLRPLFNEYVWWFIAMLLVISGSIMGIREAWLRFEGVARPLTILFAFFAYHGLFLGLGTFLMRKNAATGRMLTVLSALLVPVMFSIANSVARDQAEAGALATAISFALSAITLILISKRLEINYFSSLCYLPLPFALAALAPLATPLPWLSPVLISAIGAAILAASGALSSTKPMQKLALSLLGLGILIWLVGSLTLATDDDLSRTLRVVTLILALAQVSRVMRELDFSKTKIFTAIEIVLYAIISVLAIAGAKTFAGAQASQLNLDFRIAIYPVAIAVFMRMALDHNAAIHPLIFLTMLFSLHTARIFTAHEAWLKLAFFSVPLALPWIFRTAHEKKKKLFLYWAVSAGIIGSLIAMDGAPHWAKAAIGLITALTIHRAAGLSRSAFHYLSPIGLFVFVAQAPIFADSRLQPHEVFFAIALIYAVGGWIFEKKAAASDTEGHPIDDLSLLCGFIALLTIGSIAPRNEWDHFIALGPIWLFLTLRSLRDRSALVSLAANLIAIVVFFNLLRIRDYANAAGFAAAVAVACYLISALLQTQSHPIATGRIFLKLVKLPFDCRGRNNIAYAAGLTAVVMLGSVFVNAVGWLSTPDFAMRPIALGSIVTMLVISMVAFHFRTLSFLRLRGNIALLFYLLIGIALAAITNRLGRPLPVDQVALRLLILFPLMALITAGVVVYGPRYGKYLEAEAHGKWYYLVPVTAVFGITALLAYEIVALSAFDFDRVFANVPFLFYLSIALYPLILAHTVGSRFRHSFFAFAPVFCAATLAQLIPGDYLAFRQHIVQGFSAGVFVLALLAFAMRHNSYFTESGYWSIGYTALIALLSFQVAAILPGAILLVVALLYLASKNIRSSAFIFFVSGLLLVHGGAHLTNVYPTWPGPALALAAICMLYPARRLAAKLDLAEDFVLQGAFVAGVLYIFAAFFYAATEGFAANALQAGWSVLTADFNYIATGAFYRSPSLTLVYFLTSVYFYLASQRILGRSQSALAFIAHFAFAGFLSTGIWLTLNLSGANVFFMSALPFVLAIILIYEIFITARLKKWREDSSDIYAGHFSARDLMIVICGIMFIPLSQNFANPIAHASVTLLIALILYLVLNVQAAFTSQKTRYVYIAELTIAGIYYSLKPLLGITNPAIDAFIALGYAFLLVGLALLTDRLGWQIVSEPTRRFAAFMPIVAALVVDNFRTLPVVMLSLLSSGLYFSLSRLGERNIFAALAAVTLNAALFFFSLSQGFDSSEFYALPMGLTIIFFATIFKGSLTTENQARVRMIGGLIAYVPAALQVTLRSGLAANGMYSVAFGIFCLLGILAGTILRIRSYLFLGALFLSLDIVANLVQEGLQNQFVGFILLTVTGLALIAILIFFNLRRDVVLAYLARSRERFKSWR